MFHVSHPKLPIRIAPARARSRASAVRRAHAPSLRAVESIAAPLTLAAVVVGTLSLAVLVALITALGS